jgi:hypothetical protein
VFERVEALVHAAAGASAGTEEIVPRPSGPEIIRAAVPYLDEPWYC